MPQQLDSMTPTSRPGTWRRVFSTAPMAPNAFWWQWPWTSARRQPDGRSGRGLAADARNSSNRTARSASAEVLSPGSMARNSSRKVRRQDGSRPDHRQAALDIGGQRVEDAPGFVAGLVDEAGGEEGAAAAQGAAVRRDGHGHAVAGGLEHAQGGARVLGLEPGREGVRQEDDVGLVRRSSFGRPEDVAVPARQGAAGAEAEQALAGAAQARHGFAQVGEAGHAGGLGCVARQIGDQPVLRARGRGAGGSGAGPRSSSAPCRRRSGTRAGRPCSSRRAPASPSSRRR